MTEQASVRPSRLKAVIRAAFGLQSDPAVVRNVISGATASGKVVTASNAMELATVWACVRLLSETVATLPFVVYRTRAGGAREAAPDLPLYGMLHDAPSADYTAVEFWEGVMLCLCLWGNAFARKERIGERVVALTPLRCELMSVRRTASGAREYRYSDPRGLQILSEDDVFHVRGFGGAGDLGLSPIGFARQSLGTAMAADELAGAMFANGMRPTGVFTMDQVLDAKQRRELRDNIVAPFVGSQNAGGVMVLEGSMKFAPISMTPEDSQFLETRSFHVEEICRWFRVPPFMVGHTEKSSSWGTGLESQMTAFLTFALRPYLARIEQAVKRSLILPQDRASLKAEFNVEGLLRADSKARAEYHQIMVSNGIATRNEARARENLPPLPGGDALTVQSQNVPLGQLDRAAGEGV